MLHHPFITKVGTRLADLLRRATPPSGSKAADGLLVALSGGPDSVALLLVAKAWSEQTGAAVEAGHLNHQLRGQEADSDERFCRGLCERLDIRLHVERRDPKAEIPLKHRGLEEAARIVRYRFLEKLVDRSDRLRCAATGHHRDDQVETVLMRLFRGAGLEGLCGIPPISRFVIRPLLDVNRTVIISFLEEMGQPYRLDSSNERGENTRSRVRRELLPLARDIFGSGADGGPARLAGLISGDLELLDDLADKATKSVIEPIGPEDPLSSADQDLRAAVAPLQALDRALARRVVRNLLRICRGSTRDVALVHVDAMLDWLPESRSGGSLDLGGGWKILREFDLLRFVSPKEPPPPVSATGSYRILVRDAAETLPRGTDYGTERSTATAASSPDGRARHLQWQLECPADCITGRLRLRAWRPGDRIALLGLGGHKKVSDLLQERRIGVSDRSGVMVAEDDDGILWVVGVARAERTRVLPSTGRKVTIAVVSTARDGEDEDF